MFDCHYDLLTYIYLKRNDISFIKSHCEKIFRNGNLRGGIFNLFFMSPQEMEEELHIKQEELDIIKMLKIVKELIKQYNLIPTPVQYLIGIEGLDYLEKVEDIDVLYDLGLRSTNIVWNNQNKFGGGARANRDCGLTALGEELVEKLIYKKIAIDLSHANERTFKDIIYICNKKKKQGYHPIVIASHSNCKSICNVPRNLTDQQILQIKNLDGVIGLVSYKRFCIDVSEEIIKGEVGEMNFKEQYMKHINHVKILLGGTENICVSTDDMGYYDINLSYYNKANVFYLYNVKKELEVLLEQNGYSKMEIENILYQNAYNRLVKYLKFIKK